MFNIEIYNLLIQAQENKPIEDHDRQYLDEALSVKEQTLLGVTATELRSAASFADLIGVLDYYPDTFAEAYGIDADSVARWTAGDMTSFERKSLEFFLLREVYDELRVHNCPMCDRIHFDLNAPWGICEDCWEHVDADFARFVLAHREYDDAP